MAQQMVLFRKPRGKKAVPAEPEAPEPQMNRNLNARQHGTQLPMFMSPEELGQQNSVDYPGYNVEEARPVAEYSHRGRRYRGAPSMAHYMSAMGDFLHQTGGVESPVTVLNYKGVDVPEEKQRTPYGRQTEMSPYLIQGHHRVWSELENNSDRLVPVEHETTDDPDADIRGLAQQAGWRDHFRTREMRNRRP